MYIVLFECLRSEGTSACFLAFVRLRSRSLLLVLRTPCAAEQCLFQDCAVQCLLLVLRVVCSHSCVSRFAHAGPALTRASRQLGVPNMYRVLHFVGFASLSRAGGLQ